MGRAGGDGFSAYAILSAYVVAFVKFVRESRAEQRQRQVPNDKWREERGFPKRTPWWVSDGSLDDRIFWFTLPVNIVLAIYFFRTRSIHVPPQMDRRRD
jgi:hypothetical protein